MKLSNQQEQQLKALIEMETPKWVTKEIYTQLVNEWGTLKIDYDQFIESVSNLFGIPTHEMIINPVWKSISVRVSPKVFTDLYQQGRLISSPATGQDPKIVIPENIQTASEHAGYQWGNSEGAHWLEWGTFNLILYPGAIFVLEPVDVEHRLWGLIGFQLGIVSLSSDKPLFYEDIRLIDGKIEVNDLTLSEIVVLANDNVKAGVTSLITQDDILKRFNKGKFLTTILPMYSEAECHEYYRVKNKRSGKTKPQLMHAKDEVANLMIKKFSSLKNHRFAASSDCLHPFYQYCFSNSSKTSLYTFMLSHLLFQYLNSNGFLKHYTTDSSLIDEFVKTKGYTKCTIPYDTNSEKQLLEILDYLYDMFSRTSNQKDPSKQRILLLLELTNYLTTNNLFIYDKDAFMTAFNSFWDEKYYTWKKDENGIEYQTDTRDEFGNYVTNSDPKSYNKAFTILRVGLLCNDDKSLVYDKSIINSLGIKEIGGYIPRLFTSKVIEKSAKINKNLDIDGKEFNPKEKPVGGHIISDFELSFMSDEERDEALLNEGINGGFKHDNNCRAMSSYHNLRMNVLRLSEYMKIINEDDSVIRQAIAEKRKQILNHSPKKAVAKKKK
jgi:hypothetical protein